MRMVRVDQDCQTSHASRGTWLPRLFRREVHQATPRALREKADGVGDSADEGERMCSNKIPPRASGISTWQTRPCDDRVSAGGMGGGERTTIIILLI